MKQSPIQIQYDITPEGAVLLYMQGRAAEVRIPEAIGGVPVVAVGERAFAVAEEFPVAQPSEERQGELHFTTELLSPTGEGQALRRLYLPDTVKTIGAYAFAGCAALERLHLPKGLTALPAHLLDGCTALEQVVLPASVCQIGEYAFHNCRSLQALQLPKSVESIGRYAFYNCRKLEKINIPTAARQLNTGLFLNCDALREIGFGQCRHISDLIAVLNHELHLTIDFPAENGEIRQAKLVIPDFQYEYIEDTPARQFHQVNYGTGHIFRQCIGNSEIDFRRYDEIFYLTRREDTAVTVLLLAMSRLEYPYKLEEHRREMYLDYIRSHFIWAAEYFMNQNEAEKIRLFAQWGLLTAQTLPPLLELAQKKGQTAILSFLMDYQHKHFGAVKQKKTFDL